MRKPRTAQLPAGRVEENGVGDPEVPAEQIARTVRRGLAAQKAPAPPSVPAPPPSDAYYVAAEAASYVRWLKIVGGCVVAQDIIRADVDFRSGPSDLNRDLPAAGVMVAEAFGKLQRGEQ